MSKAEPKGASAAPYSVLNTVEALLQQAIQLLEIQRQTLATPALQSETSQNQNQQELMDVKEAVKYLGVSEWGLRESVRNKSIPHVRLQRRIFFRKRELDHWISMGMTSGGGG